MVDFFVFGGLFEEEGLIVWEMVGDLSDFV